MNLPEWVTHIAETPDGGLVCLRHDMDGEGDRFFNSDTGRGWPSEVLEGLTAIIPGRELMDRGASVALHILRDEVQSGIKAGAIQTPSHVVCVIDEVLKRMGWE